MEQEQKKKKVWSKNIWTWKIDDAELRYQVEKYNQLKITQSSRGAAVLLTLIILVFSIALMVALETFDLVSTLALLVIYTPFLVFVLKGYRWAIIVLMALWTIDKLASLTLDGSLMAIIWWIVVFGVYRKALIVENARRKNAPTEKKNL